MAATAVISNEAACLRARFANRIQPSDPIRSEHWVMHMSDLTLVIDLRRSNYRCVNPYRQKGGTFSFVRFGRLRDHLVA